MANYPIQEQSLSAQQFQVPLDDVIYQATVYWLAFGQRYYLRISDDAGNVIVNIPLVSSDYTENLVAGYFENSTITYSQPDGLMVVLP